MIWKNKLVLFIAFFVAEIAFAQLDTYNYSREINNISETWHSIDLPNGVFEKVSNNLNDFRIYGITETDTIEAPYLLKIIKTRQPFSLQVRVGDARCPNGLMVVR